MFTNEREEGIAIKKGARWQVALAVLRVPAMVSIAAVVLGPLAIGCSAKTSRSEPARASAAEEVWETAQLTTFTSFPACCPDSPVYDPDAPTSECDDYSACEYMGEFAAIGEKSFEWVQSHDLIAFYDDADPDGSGFNQKYGGRRIKLRKDGEEFEALIADTCGNQDCNDCCSENSQGGYLVDVEFWTAERNLGGAQNADGTIEFQILERNSDEALPRADR
jgi:hypothetical protein